MEVPLTKRQLKRRRNKNSKLNKKFRNLSAEVNDLKSRMEEMEDQITKASQSTSARFKREKIRSMKRDVSKIIEKLRESEKFLKSIESKISNKPKSNKRIEAKITKLNKKIRRAKNKRNKERLIAKQDSLKLKSNWGLRSLDGAFGGAYRRYKIDGIQGMDVNTFFSKTKKLMIELLNKETANRAVRSQAITWIRFVKDGVEMVDLAFNSTMMPVYELNDKDEIVTTMIEHMAQQIEYPALRNSKFVFDRVIHMDIDFHRLNLTRGSSYIPLPDWLTKKKAIINPRNSDTECFKWAVITAMKWEEIDRDCKRVSKLRHYENDFDWDGVKFPASLRDIKRFESRKEITINILALEGKKVYICRKGKEYEQSMGEAYNRVANLMLITDGNRKHYVAIKLLRRLLSSQNSKHKKPQHFCTNCLQGLATKISRTLPIL